ncbi:C40 family peptidase [uncultured Rossellomorea sp.]|uniref:C40 family peptidase n=1 Tax=uncultured Rossellomorea sp. TaxID=2837549 RepID=UPI002611EF85|nr:C40 family peptidase [uncultured Rossellomorea sp.]
MTTKALIAVPVSTVWTSKDSARDLDSPAISNPVQINEWLDSLTHETRLALCDENRIQSQALFGQEVLVMEESNGWSHVIIPDQASSKDSRGYPGWVPSVQLSQGELPQTDTYAIVKSKFTDLINGKNEIEMELSFQTVLPVVKEHDHVIEVATPIGTRFVKQKDVFISSTKLNDQKGSGQDIVTSGEAFLHLPYLWGGMTSYGFDCSGFSYTMCKANGYLIPRDANDQAKEGKEVKLDQLEPGDLLFFAYEEGKGSIHHVGIYHGDGQMIHSPNTGKTIEILSLKGTYYEKELCIARRYWEETEESS